MTGIKAEGVGSAALPLPVRWQLNLLVWATAWFWFSHCYLIPDVLSQKMTRCYVQKTFCLVSKDVEPCGLPTKLTEFQLINFAVWPIQ